MGRTVTPTYRIEVKTNEDPTIRLEPFGLFDRELKALKAFGNPLEAFVKKYNESFLPGGVNEHVTEGLGRSFKIVRAILKNNHTNEHLATWHDPDDIKKEDFSPEPEGRVADYYFLTVAGSTDRSFVVVEYEEMGTKIRRPVDSVSDFESFLADQAERAGLSNVSAQELWTVMCSSSLDFPDEYTSDPKVISLCASLRQHNQSVNRLTMIE